MDYKRLFKAIGIVAVFLIVIIVMTLLISVVTKSYPFALIWTVIILIGLFLVGWAVLVIYDELE